jgi:hypothetical protein
MDIIYRHLSVVNKEFQRETAIKMCPGQDLKLAPPKYESGTLPIHNPARVDDGKSIFNDISLLLHKHDTWDPSG